MGSFYVNFSVKQNDPQPIVDTLKRARLKAIVTPPSNGFVVVCEEKSDRQDTKAIEEVGGLLTREVAAPVFAILNHDDDILCYWLFDQGRLVDKYDSCPDYFGPSEELILKTGGDVQQLCEMLSVPSGGDAQQLCEMLSVPSAVDEVERILRADHYVFALDRHSALVEVLGLPSYTIGWGYRYVVRGTIPDGLKPDQLIRVG
jgi:hypothetical protein